VDASLASSTCARVGHSRKVPTQDRATQPDSTCVGGATVAILGACTAPGADIYVCQSGASGAAWTLQAPDAELFGPRHYAGPTWEALDGSTVVAARIAEVAPDPTAIPWLLLGASSSSGSGSGKLSQVTYIQRLDTVGGLAPLAGCDDVTLGANVSVEYTATYYFYVPAPRGKGSSE